MLTHWGRLDLNHTSNTAYGPDNYSTGLTWPDINGGRDVTELWAGHPCYDPKKVRDSECVCMCVCVYGMCYVVFEEVLVCGGVRACVRVGCSMLTEAVYGYGGVVIIVSWVR